MDTIKIRALDAHTAHICALRLVGGFDNIRYRSSSEPYDPITDSVSHKTHFPALDTFRSPFKEHLQYRAELAEVGCRQSQIFIEDIIIQELRSAEDLELDGKKYIFDIQTFQCPVAMDYVLWEVLAQINDD